MVKRICFVSSRSGFFCDSGKFRMDWANGRLINALLTLSDYSWSVAIFADPADNTGYDFTIEGVPLYPLPFPIDYVSGIRNTFRIWKVLRELEKEHDLLIVQLPIAGFLPLLFIRRPVIYHLCANVLTASNNPFKYRSLKLLVARSFAWCIHCVNRVNFGKSRNRLLVNGSELGLLYRAYRPHVGVSSSVYRREVVTYVDTQRNTKDEFVILFVGRPSKEKGVHILLQAFEELIKTNRRVCLRMIGFTKEVMIRELSDRPMNLIALNSITCYGKMTWNDEFKSLVSGSHVLIMSSISEGTPRVIIEARALR